MADRPLVHLPCSSGGGVVAVVDDDGRGRGCGATEAGVVDVDMNDFGYCCYKNRTRETEQKEKLTWLPFFLWL